MRKLLTTLASPAIIVLILAASAPAAIHLKSGTIDTRSATAAAALPTRHMGTGYYLVELKGPVTDSGKASLEAAGAQPVEYVPDNAFIVRLEHAQASAVRKLECVRWIGPFRPEHKSMERLRADSRPEQFIVRLFPGQDPGFVMAKAALFGAKKIDCVHRPGGATCRILANTAQIEKLAGLGAVAWIEPYVQPRLCNDVASAICGVPEVRQNLGLYGAGQLVGVADAGLDTGNLSTISPDFAGRIEKTYALRRPGEWSDLNGHGTHILGSLLGSGVLSGSNPATRSYEGSFAGLAPEARLVFQSIGDAGALVFPPLHLAELFQPVYEDGVRIHSNSWGSAVSGQYTTYSNQVDQFIWDHKDLTVVFAVGNEAQDRDQNGVIDRDNIYAPATAKNCISVGATETQRITGGYQMGYGVAWPGSYPAAPIKYDLVSNNPSGVAAFSGRGPTDDGRIKPDICAPGTNIVSCRSRACAVTGWGAYNSDYIYWGGTSMSTPQVAGAAALVREYYQREKGVNASAALVKSTLINGATDISPGQYGTGQYREVLPAPDTSQGWGRLNVRRSLFPDPPEVNEFADESAGISTGEYREYHYTVIDASVPLRATLVWTDYPGAVHAAKELVNDLDLTIISPTGTLYPNSGIRDRSNNVEQIRIDSPELGTYLVRVSGYSVPMGPQDYSLVVAGGLPSTYMAGRVTSESGAGVQGALITLVSANQVKRVTTNTSGRFITHVSPDTYSVQIGKPGWTFTPRSRIVQVVDAPVEDVDFSGSGTPGAISGRVTSAIGGVISHVVESPHPYLNSFDQTYTITAHEEATRVRVHFAEIDLMNDGDAIYVLDGADNLVNTYTGRGEDIWSSWASGRVIKIRLVSNDFGNIGYGFYVDGYETDLIEQGGTSDVTLALFPGGAQSASNGDGLYNVNSVPPGTYTVVPSKAHWKFQPASRMVDIPAGGSVAGVDFLAFPPGSVTGEVRAATSEVRSVNVESPHPYPDNYTETWTIDGGESANRIRIHFSEISTEPAWDLIFLMDGNGSVVEIYTGYEQDLWTPWVNGGVAEVMLSSDGSESEYGFRIDKYEIELVGPGLEGVAVELTPDGRAETTSGLGWFSFANVDVGSHTVIPRLELWAFDPISTTVSISPGTAQHLLFYAKMGDLTRPAQCRSLSDGTQVTLRNVVISAVFGGHFYVQDADRTGGMRIVSGAVVQEGSAVDVTGTLTTIGGERMISAASVVVRQ